MRALRIITALLILGSAFASADTISFTVSVGPTTSPFDQTYTFAGFDPTLGSLNTVTLNADEFVTTTGSISNLSQYTGPWHIQLSGLLRALFTNSAGSSDVATPPLDPGRLVTIPSIDPNTSYFANLTGADGNAIGLNSDYSLGTETVAQYFEQGPITADLQAQGSSYINVPADVMYSSSLTTSISGDFSVIYDYTPTPVPEPSSGQMIAIGLAGLIPIVFKKIVAA